MKTPTLMFATLFGILMVFDAWAAEKAALAPPVYLPDGQEFKTWEVPLKFSHTYYVAQQHPKTSDDNPGTEARPFKTISRAARVLQPGQRVVVGTGIYRERVRPARGGTGPERMISYEAAPRATVIISGSVILDTKWTQSTGDGQNRTDKLWTTKLPVGLFIGENPFAELNLSDEQIDKGMPWAIDTKGKAPNALRRGLIFLNGQRLRQVATKQELATVKGSYWVEQGGLTIHLRPLEDKDPNHATIEITAQEMVFSPKTFGLGYIRVKGFTIEHSGNRFPRPQQGALSTLRGHHWIIEENTIRQCNAIGIDIGDQMDTSGPPLAEGGQHIVRRNTVSDCGIGGIEGKAIEHTLIEENCISRCGWQHAELICETGGIKVHCTVGTLIRRNIVQWSINAPGIWMDAYNRNSRCTQNVVIRTTSRHGGILMEASQAPNLVDHNIIWGSTTNGIYQQDCDELVIAHNLIGKCKDAGIRLQTCPGRTVGERLTTAKRNKILNNIIVDVGQMLAFSDPDNVCDGNLFGTSREPFDIVEWRQKYDWDQNSAMADIRASLDPLTLKLTWSVGGMMPECQLPARITSDFRGRAYSGQKVSPGPFQTVPTASAEFLLDCVGVCSKNDVTSE